MGHQLFDDNPQGRPRLAGLGYGDAKRARRSVRRLRHMPYAYQIQAAQTMYYRAKHHAHQTTGMREAMRIYQRFLRTTQKQR
jgi:hypothetical protein